MVRIPDLHRLWELGWTGIRTAEAPRPEQLDDEDLLEPGIDFWGHPGAGDDPKQHR